MPNTTQKVHLIMSQNTNRKSSATPWMPSEADIASAGGQLTAKMQAAPAAAKPPATPMYTTPTTFTNTGVYRYKLPGER